MKRTEMLDSLEDFCSKNRTLSDRELAVALLCFAEDRGMAPPHLDGEREQAIISTYVFPNTRMWEETFDADPKLASCLKRRQEIDAMTPEQRKQFRSRRSL